MKVQYMLVSVAFLSVAAAGVIQNGVDTMRKIRGISGQDINGLSPAQQFCAYHKVSGSAGLHQLQHKIQNAVLGESIECSLVKALGVKMPEGSEGHGENNEKQP